MAHIDVCGEHDGCLVIESDGWPDAAGSWQSHFEDDVDPGERLNPDGPQTFTDRRTGTTVAPKVPTQRAADRLAGHLTRDDQWVGPVDPSGNPARGGSPVRR